MTIIQKINAYLKKRYQIFTFINAKALRIEKLNPIIFLSFVIIFSGLFFIASNLINQKNKKNTENFREIAETNEFSSLTNFFISKINSPYEEASYIIKNNDTVEKILKNFKVRNDDIKKISTQLKKKKLAKIYSGRKLSIIIKKLEDGNNTVVSFIYPVNNTSSVEVRKSKEKFLVKENISR